jgi:glycosyltransferase involved in cell wall biosynthesis
VVDDCSTDDIATVIQRFDEPRMRYIRHDANRGGSAARNTGIKAATGEFIAFLDDDDEWEPEKTVRQLKLLDRYDAALCTRHGAINNRYRRKERVTPDDLRKGHFTAGGTSILLARANVLRDTLFDESLPGSQDWDIFIRLAQKYAIGYLNEPLVHQHKGTYPRISNRIRNMGAREIENECRMLRKHEHFLGTKWFRRHMCRKLLSGIRTPRDKMTDIIYTARRYGAVNVLWVLGKYFLVKKRINLQRLAIRLRKRRQPT